MDLGSLREHIDEGVGAVKADCVVPRIWAHDHTVWGKGPEEVANRLGWLHSMGAMLEALDELTSFAAEIRDAGYCHGVLLGMGGSSLAPDVFRRVFGKQPDGLALNVLDTTDADAVLACERQLDLERTLFIVATKSGGTVETLSALNYFYTRVMGHVGARRVGEHFVAITDPGSSLHTLADALRFRRIFLNDPTLGGRFSVFSYFGLVPAALLGLDVRRLLDRGAAMAEACGPAAAPENNPAALLGVAMGDLADKGRDKLTLVSSAILESFGDWAEQLVAESTGKDGKGILPVVGEHLGPADGYEQDRLFVALHLTGDESHEDGLVALEAAGHPVIRLVLDDLYDLGGQFFLWEMATAIAGARMGIQPFNQPNVESAKAQARKAIAAYRESGSLEMQPSEPPDAEVLQAFVSRVSAGGYIGIHAYVEPTPETDAALMALRERLREQTGKAVTVGYGPRFLHSTGQLHKGDSGNGSFIQLVSDPREDVPIPDEPGMQSAAMTFGVLKLAQAVGDYYALREAGRRVVCFHLGREVLEGIERLIR